MGASYVHDPETSFSIEHQGIHLTEDLQEGSTVFHYGNMVLLEVCEIQFRHFPVDSLSGKDQRQQKKHCQ